MSYLPFYLRAVNSKVKLTKKLTRINYSKILTI